MENHLQLNAVFVSADEGGFTGYFVEFPEAVAEGETQQEVESNLVHALKTILELRREENDGTAVLDEGRTTKMLNFSMA